MVKVGKKDIKVSVVRKILSAFNKAAIPSAKAATSALPVILK